MRWQRTIMPLLRNCTEVSEYGEREEGGGKEMNKNVLNLGVHLVWASSVVAG